MQLKKSSNSSRCHPNNGRFLTCNVVSLTSGHPKHTRPILATPPYTYNYRVLAWPVVVNRICVWVICDMSSHNHQRTFCEWRQFCTAGRKMSKQQHALTESSSSSLIYYVIWYKHVHTGCALCSHSLHFITYIQGGRKYTRQCILCYFIIVCFFSRVNFLTPKLARMITSAISRCAKFR